MLIFRLSKHVGSVCMALFFILASEAAYAADFSLTFDKIKNTYTLSYPISDNETHVTEFELGNKIDPEVMVKIQEDPSQVERYKYTYTYDVKNKETAKQLLEEFFLVFPISSKSFVRIPPEARTSYIIQLQTADTVAVDQYLGETVPFYPFDPTAITAPENWTAVLPFPPGIWADSNVLYYSWDSRKEQSEGRWGENRWGMAPGEASRGFSIQSPLPPAIGVALFTGAPRKEADLVEPIPSSVGHTLAKLESTRNSAIRRKTLIPRMLVVDALPDGCETYVTNLVSQVREAAALGWIKDDLRNSRAGNGNDGKGRGAKMERICHRPGTPAEMTLRISADAVAGHLKHGDRRGPCGSQQGELPEVAQTVIETLAQIREHCMAGHFSAARSLLRDLIDLTGRERGTMLTDEAYYLIRFNAEFLLEEI